MGRDFINKNLFLNARACPTLGWYLYNQPLEAPPTEGDQFRMEQGKEIGRLARTLFANGQFIQGGTTDAAADKTRKFLANSNVDVFFEATFLDGSYVAKPDIIQRESNGWKVIEVKSSLATTSQIEELVDDLAYTSKVMRNAGVKIISAELMLLNGNYRKGQPANQLFETLDQTEAATDRDIEYETNWRSLPQMVKRSPPPKPKLSSACRSCPYFEGHCLGKNVEHTVFSLPRLHPKKLEQLSSLDVVDVRKLPRGFELTEVQERVVKCIETGRPHISKSLSARLAEIRWPVSYLDFETVMTSLPLYDGLPPYAQVATQYSLHRRRSPRAQLEHAEYLADPMRDCEEELTERLLHDCGTSGSIVVYSSFEKTRINSLAKRFPRLEKRLFALNDRLFDLLKVIQDCVYHLEFDGSFSIKKVLPVIVPELSYDGLAIGNGDSAVARFAKAAMGKWTEPEVHKMRLDLFEYCKQDTLAMVRLHERLVAGGRFTPNQLRD